jgi:hypothetical protein
VCVQALTNRSASPASAMQWRGARAPCGRSPRKSPHIP